jgi:hypothetical protein
VLNGNAVMVECNAPEEVLKTFFIIKLILHSSEIEAVSIKEHLLAIRQRNASENELILGESTSFVAKQIFYLT